SLMSHALIRTSSESTATLGTIGIQPTGGLRLLGDASIRHTATSVQTGMSGFAPPPDAGRLGGALADPFDSLAGLIPAAPPFRISIGKVGRKIHAHPLRRRPAPTPTKKPNAAGSPRDAGRRGDPGSRPASQAHADAAGLFARPFAVVRKRWIALHPKRPLAFERP